MIYLKLFINFLIIGTVSFGGGYGMISLVQETVLKNNWLNQEEFINFIAISESTPGSLAVNMATFIGAKQKGVLGALSATVGVILPSFIIILLIVSIIKNFLNNKYVNDFLKDVRPCVIALILATALNMFPNIFINNAKLDCKAIVIFLILFLITILSKKKTSPIILIIISALLGILLYH